MFGFSDKDPLENAINPNEAWKCTPGLSVDQSIIEDYEARIEMLKRRIAQLESNVKPASDLWGQHKQMIKLAEDYRLYLASNWAVNMSGNTVGENKPTAPASLVEDIIGICSVILRPDVFKNRGGIKEALDKAISKYRPQTDIVVAIIAKAKSRHISGGTTQAEGWITENEIEEIIRKYEGEK